MSTIELLLLFQGYHATATTTITPVLLVSVLVTLTITPAEGYHSHEYEYHEQEWAPAYRRHHWANPWAQPRTIWQTARSMVPRFANVAYETASSLSIPALALITLFVLWPEHKHYRTKRDSGGKCA